MSLLEEGVDKMEEQKIKNNCTVTSPSPHLPMQKMKNCLLVGRKFVFLKLLLGAGIGWHHKFCKEHMSRHSQENPGPVTKHSIQCAGWERSPAAPCTVLALSSILTPWSGPILGLHPFYCVLINSHNNLGTTWNVNAGGFQLSFTKAENVDRCLETMGPHHATEPVCSKARKFCDVSWSICIRDAVPLCTGQPLAVIVTF